MYVAYHLTSDPTPFGGTGWIKAVYLLILLSHIALSIIIIPLVLFTYVRALSQQFDKHKNLAKITYPIWLYVAITGVIVYLMISPYYAK
jgi:putative membrane protein